MREYESPSPARPCLGAIWAQTDAGIIGRDGTMPWRAPEDLAHFKTVTVGNARHHGTAHLGVFSTEFSTAA